jgi:hypothetical protein
MHNLICIYVLVHPEQFVSLYQAQRDVAGTLTRVEIMFPEIMHMTGDVKQTKSIKCSSHTLRFRSNVVCIRNTYELFRRCDQECFVICRPRYEWLL